MHNTASTRSTSLSRLWSGLLLSVLMMLLGNFLLVRRSLNSLEIAKTKAQDSMVQSAQGINIIVLNDDEDTIEMMQNDDSSATTTSVDEVNSTPPNSTEQSDSAAQEEDQKTPSGVCAPTANGMKENHSIEAKDDINIPCDSITSNALQDAVITRDLQGFSITANQVSSDEEHDTKNVSTLSTLSQQLSFGEQTTSDECFTLRDYGFVDLLKSSSRSFCTGDLDSSIYTVFDVPIAEFSSTKLQNIVIDMRSAEVSHDIYSLAQDGGGHDPRFRYKPNSVFCNCTGPQDSAHGAPNIWKHLLADGPSANEPTCQLPPPNLPDDVLSLERAVVLTRKDDHNPFFQISAILNAWMMMKVVGWDSASTHLVTFDRALPSPIDELRNAMLSPQRPVIGGSEIQRRVLRFEAMLLAPYEARGPIMSHLDDDQPCYDNKLITDFRNLALKTMSVSPKKTEPRRCLITVISRRPYGGRQIQRVWRNEAEVINRMSSDYNGTYRFGECAFQSLDFVNLTMHEQMRVMVDSDVVIGMHGAGMVNVMWTRPGTLVVEIFPRRRLRWGYRNLCQFLGCSWHEFREGQDLLVRTTDPNDMDKYIAYEEWDSFFAPLFRDAIRKLEREIEEE
ncbi:unnamed protein product [Phytophthora lilii]|uniref:Unnamed protein product n=1 Tax=Phytophthora lilii TaxID=2077276 RepID=A0A9W6WK68_9STRA|nr:unnamed protein product [Phytophthora lilii]